MSATKTEILNPIAVQAEQAAMDALREKVDQNVTVKMESILESLGDVFAAPINENREPTPEEIASAITYRGGEDAMAFSNDNKGQAWYVPNRLVPLVLVMIPGDGIEAQIALLRAHIFDQDFLKALPKDKADKLLAERVAKSWGKKAAA